MPQSPISLFPHGQEAHRPAPRWDDLRVEPTIRITGATNPGRDEWFDSTGLHFGTAGAGDIHLYTFDDSATEKEIRFNVQMPHAWDGSLIHPHVYWVGDATATPAKPRWGLQYTWAGIGSGFPPTKTIYTTRHKVGNGREVGVVAGRHYMTQFPGITPDKNQDGISSIMLCRLFRNSSHAEDTYTGRCGLLYVDFHYRIDGFGSRQEYIK